MLLSATYYYHDTNEQRHLEPGAGTTKRTFLLDLFVKELATLGVKISDDLVNTNIVSAPFVRVAIRLEERLKVQKRGAVPMSSRFAALNDRAAKRMSIYRTGRKRTATIVSGPAIRGRLLPKNPRIWERFKFVP